MDLISAENLVNNLFQNGHLRYYQYQLALKHIRLIPIARNRKTRIKHIKALINIIPELSFVLG